MNNFFHFFFWFSLFLFLMSRNNANNKETRQCSFQRGASTIRISFGTRDRRAPNEIASRLMIHHETSSDVIF